MRVKDLERTVNVAWSPAKHHPILLAAGTAAQQLDASFSTTSALELFSLNLSDPGADMERVAGIPMEQRFHQVVWGPGAGAGDDSGVIIGGCDGGIIQIFSPSKMIAGQEALMIRKDGHTGAVRALDLNPFQTNLLASGASDSEIFIWDLEQMTNAMTPGAKAQPPDVVGCLSWNRQVQHILASTFPSRCIVWDLRKNEPIIKLVDTTSHVRWRSVNWHPDVATQLCLASEDDMTPAVQLWDLRFATSPLKSLAGHSRGVTCIAWCMHDPDLLLSCGRDNKILCWNPNETTPGAELVCEIQSPNQWLFDVAWCPRNPTLISSSSFDGHVSIYSLMGGQQQAIPTTNKIADSFPGMENITPAHVTQHTQQPHVHTTVELRKPPKWLRRPTGVSFAFGGRLVQFAADQPGRVTISQMVSEPLLLERAAKLENAMTSGQQVAFCMEQANSASSPHLRTLWRFLSAEFTQNPRSEVLSLLGYSADQFSDKVNSLLGNPEQISQLTNDVSELNVGDEKKTDEFPDNDLLSGSFQVNGTSSAEQSFKEKTLPFTIPTSDDPESLIGQALLLGHTEAAVELCLKQGRMADALLLAMTGGTELLARTQFRYFEKSKGWLSKIISAVVSEDWSNVVSSCSTASWRQALAAAITHTTGDEFFHLCQSLGERLEAEEISGLSQNAQICYLCSGNIEKLVQSWTSSGAPSDPLQLQELVQVIVLLQAASRHQGASSQTSLALAELLTNYAFLLASQGSFSSAFSYLETAHEEAALELKDRLQQSLGIVGRQQQGMNLHHKLVNQGRRPSGPYNPSVPTYSNQSRSRTVSQSSYDGYGGTSQPVPFVPPPPVSASPQLPNDSPYMQPSYNAPATTPPSITSKPGRKYVADPSVQNPFSSSYSTNTYSSSPNIYGSSQSAAPYMPPMPSAGVPPSTMYNPSAVMEGQTSTSYGSYRQPDVPPQPSAPPRQTRPVMETDPGPPGWNDPPTLTSRQPPKTEYVQQTPITHPLFGTMPQEQQPPPSPGGHMNGGMYAPQMQQSFSQPQNYPMSYSPQVFQPQPQLLQPAAAPSQAPPAPALVAEPPKPIPDAYAHLPKIFEELRDKCAQNAGNPLTRRKLEDVARKLEALYEALREYKLSATTLDGLSHMCQLIQMGDYASGLQLHTQMVSGADFSRISSFMPGLKTLLQTAMQLGVYLQ